MIVGTFFSWRLPWHKFGHDMYPLLSFATKSSFLHKEYLSCWCQFASFTAGVSHGINLVMTCSLCFYLRLKMRLSVVFFIKNFLESMVLISLFFRWIFPMYRYGHAMVCMVCMTCYSSFYIKAIKVEKLRRMISKVNALSFNNKDKLSIVAYLFTNKETET